MSLLVYSHALTPFLACLNQAEKAYAPKAKFLVGSNGMGAGTKIGRMNEGYGQSDILLTTDKYDTKRTVLLTFSGTMKIKKLDTVIDEFDVSIF